MYADRIVTDGIARLRRFNNWPKNSTRPSQLWMAFGKGWYRGDQMDELVALAKQQLERVKVLCSQSGLNYLELAPTFMGAGVVVGFGETDYVILSVGGGGNENQLLITSGILTGIKQDRSVALEAANYFTSNNSAYPVYLHDAEVGWALLMQQTLPVELLLDVPAFFVNCVKALPQMTISYRQTIAEKWDLGGRPWQWTSEDHKGLLIRSMM